MDRRGFLNRLGTSGLVLLDAGRDLFGLPAFTGRGSHRPGPVEFGRKEFYRATAEKGLNLALETAIAPGLPESFTIQPGNKSKITGGDQRGLMYGLLEAAEQIRTHGRLAPKHSSPQVQMRGIRYFVHNKDLDAGWYYSHDFWDEHFAMLARDRFNRFNLVFAHQTNYLAPPYPFWVELTEFPGIRVPGLTTAQRDRNIEMLRYISQNAADHGIDFCLGIWEQNAWPTMKPMAEGITPKNVGPYAYAALKKVLQLCPGIRSVQIRTNQESGIPADQQLKFYGDYFYPALRDCGRRVTLDLRAWALKGGMLKAVENSKVPLRVSAKYCAEFLGRPYQPAETFAGYSYLDLLEKPRSYEFFWELWGLGSNRLLLWGNPEYVRRAVSTFGLGDAIGFEIDPPLAQKGFGNRPGKWDIFTGSQQDRVFWKWEPQRYWLFYMLWGRLSYDPNTPDAVWLRELELRFGAAAPDVLEAYHQSSQVINEIVATHMADPNMYIWPEINPGGLVDDYIYVQPSDWRCIASIPEAVQNRIQGVASAKQTPQQTSAQFDAIAANVDRAVARAREKVEVGNKEWASSEPDFRVLSFMARYHARKMVAADQLEHFYQTADPQALSAAKHESERALGIWENLVRLTNGLYPEQMVYGPDDVGDWKDKLPYVQYDLKLIEERENIFKQFGQFDFGFDFGAPVRQPRGTSYRKDPYVLENNVEPRFLPVSPETRYTDAIGYGWITDGSRRDLGIPLTPYSEVRSVAKDPQHLPHDVLFRDYIQGEGVERFRVKASPGEYTVVFLHPDHTTATLQLRSEDAFLTVPFPQGAWFISGLVIKRSGPRASIQPHTQITTPRCPEILHVSPEAIQAGEPLTLTLRISPLVNISVIRLYYRPVDQLAQFKMMEAGPSHLAFTIPGEDISPKWDLIYYFEILNKENGGWFEPDPMVRTPYFVVRTDSV
ncbi:MAG: hypothetical protein ACRD18_10910 [Terriglobia bacterium]